MEYIHKTLEWSSENQIIVKKINTTNALLIKFKLKQNYIYLFSL